MRSTKTEIANQLGAVPMFERCSRRDLRAIARHVEAIHVPAKKIVVEEGAHGDAFFVLLQGQVEIVHQGTTVAALGPGTHFGELALLDAAPRSATVITKTDAELAVLNTRMFKVLLRDIPTLAERLLASLASQLRDERAHSST